MGIIKFAFMMIIRDLKQSICYITCIIISVAIMFNMFNLMNNEYILINGLMKSRIISITILIIIFSTIFFMAVANYYYLIAKTKDVAIATISGRNCIQVAIILCLQNLGLGLVGSIIGMIIGIWSTPIFNKQVYEIMGVGGDLSYYSFMAIGYTLLIIIPQFIMVGLIDAGYAYRKEIKDLLHIKDTFGGIKETRFDRIPNAVWWIAYFFPLISFLFKLPPKDIAQLMWVVIPIGVIGLGGLIKVYFPNLIKRLREGKLSDNKIKVISFSNLNYSLKLGGYILLGLTTFSAILLALTTHTKYPQLKMICFLAYIVVQVLLCITLIYKFVIDGITKGKFFFQLRLLGYFKKDIIKIVREEVFMFYAIAAIFTLGQMFLLIGTHIYGGFITFEMGSGLILFFICSNFISAILSYIIYISLVKNTLKKIR